MQSGIRATSEESHHQPGLFGAGRQQYADTPDLDSVSSGGSAGDHGGQWEPMARRRGGAYSATSGAYWPHRYSGGAGSCVSTRASPQRSPFVAGEVWKG